MLNNTDYQNFTEAFERIGVRMPSDEHCAKLLAWLYAYGGGVEAVVYNKKLNADIFIAQKRANLNGGEMPNLQFFRIMQKYLLEAEQIMKMNKRTDPAWVFEIHAYYNLSISQLKSENEIYTDSLDSIPRKGKREERQNIPNTVGSQMLLL